MNLVERLAKTISDGQRIAITDSGGQRITYSELMTHSGRLAQALVLLGVTPGDRVAVQVEKSPLAVALYLATLRAGAAFLPLNTAYTSTEIQYFLSDAAPAVFVCDPARETELGPIAVNAGAVTATLHRSGIGSLTEVSASLPAEFATVARGGNDLAAILYTSGTTGRSKGAVLTHDNIASNAETLCETWRFTNADVLIHALPIFHTHGLFVACNVTLFSGASMIFLPKFDSDGVFRVMPVATCLMGVPTFYVRLLENPRLTPEVTRHMRLFISGSAPLLVDTHRQWLERTGHAILERYGMTETNMIASNPYDGVRAPGTVGFPLRGVSVRITDLDTGSLMAPSDIGLIEVKGPNVFKGYWRLPEKTSEEFRPDGFFKTGDLGTFDSSGYLHIVGRSKDLIITGGYNVYPKEIEDSIDAIPGVIESAVFGLAHPDLGECVTAAVVRNTGSSVTMRDIMLLLRRHLASFNSPSTFTSSTSCREIIWEKFRRMFSKMSGKPFQTMAIHQRPKSDESSRA